MAKYSSKMTRTSSTTLSVGTITSDATRARRAKIYDFTFGSHATPADNAFLIVLQRCTAAGTNTAVTPQPLDPADFATEFDSGENHSVDATYTANQILLDIGLNQRATFRWVAAPGGELVTPATASNGVGIQTPTSTGLVSVMAVLHFEEQ